MPFAFAAVLIVAAAAGFALLATRAPRVALPIVLALGLAFPFLADTSDWSSWFDWAKRYSVVVPVILLAYAYAARARGATGLAWVPRVFPWVLAINVAEASASELQHQHWLNGALLGLAALTTPRPWSFDGRDGLLGFRDPAWQLVNTLGLTTMYVLNPVIEDGFFDAISCLWIAQLGALVLRDPQVWFSWRAYTLFVMVIQDSFVPAFSKHVYPPSFHPEQRSALGGSPLHGLILALTATALVYSVVRRYRARRVAA